MDTPAQRGTPHHGHTSTEGDSTSWTHQHRGELHTMDTPAQRRTSHHRQSRMKDFTPQLHQHRGDLTPWTNQHEEGLHSTVTPAQIRT